MRLSVNSSAFYRGAQPRPSRFPWAYDTMLPQHRVMIEQNLRLEPGFCKTLVSGSQNL